MGLTQSILLRMFGRPSGVLGRVGGTVMAHMNAEFGLWVAGLLEMQPDDRVLEVGYGPGVVIRALSKLAPAGQVAGVDPSREMLEQARARNAAAVSERRVELRHGSVDSLPFGNDSFDKALAINSMQVWPDAAAGLRELRRVLRPGGRIALGFTRHSGRSMDGVPGELHAVGFIEERVVGREDGFCVLAAKPLDA